MAALTRLILVVQGLGAAVFLATALPACCCGPDLSGPPGTITGRVSFPSTGHHTFTVYVIDANQYWQTSRASYLALPLPSGQLDFNTTIPPRYYWVAALSDDRRLGMLAPPGYVVVTARSSLTGVDITDWSGIGNYSVEIRLVLEVARPVASRLSISRARRTTDKGDHKSVRCTVVLSQVPVISGQTLHGSGP